MFLGAANMENDEDVVMMKLTRSGDAMRARRSGAIKLMRENGLFSDLNIICQDGMFKCHRIILSSESPTLQKLLV